MTMVRMRSLPKAAEELKKKDPGTDVSYWILRRWVKEGKLPSVKTGKNYLIDMNALEAYLEGRAYADR